MTNKYIIGLVIVVIACFVFAGCTQESQSTTESSVVIPEQTQDAIADNEVKTQLLSSPAWFEPGMSLTGYIGDEEHTITMLEASEDPTNTCGFTVDGQRYLIDLGFNEFFDISTPFALKVTHAEKAMIAGEWSQRCEVVIITEFDVTTATDDEVKTSLVPNQVWFEPEMSLTGYVDDVEHTIMMIETAEDPTKTCDFEIDGKEYSVETGSKQTIDSFTVEVLQAKKVGTTQQCEVKLS